MPVSKSNPQDSQKRPELAAPQRGQGTAGSPAADAPAGGATGCGFPGAAPAAGAAGAAAGELADPPIRIPQTSQKSLLAES